MNSDFIQKIHAMNQKMVLVLTGGGSLAIAELLKFGGASSTVVEAIIPYSPKALQDFLGHEPEKYCSPETARQMAKTAYDKCFVLTGDQNSIGISATCSLAKANERAGRENHAYVAICQSKPHRSTIWGIELGNVRGWNNTIPHMSKREVQEIVVASAVLQATAYSCGAIETPHMVWDDAIASLLGNVK